MTPWPSGTRPGLRSLLAPRSVAIIGASEDPTRIGARALGVLRASGFAGSIHPVNPRRDVVQGLPTVPGIAAIPGPVDCAIIAIPAEGVLAAVAECARKGVGTVILFSAGFAETGEAGRALQEEIVRVARAGGTRVLGPNCTGAYNLASGAYLSFYDSRPRPLVPGRNIGVVSQSGGYGAHIITLARARNLSVGHFVTTGNEGDIAIGEVLGAFAADPAVDVLVGYVEGVRDPEDFVAALALARANRKPVILMKSGATAAGASAASSHTGSLAGLDAAYDAVFREYGVYRAGSTEEVLDVAYAAAHGRLPAGRRAAVMTNSGGMGVQMADHAAQTGLELSPVPEDAQARILGMVPNGSARNPVDFTAQWLAEPHLIPGCLSALLEATAFDMVFCFMGSSGSNPVVLAGVGPVLARHPGTPVVMCISVEEECAAAFEALGCLVFEEPVRAMRALAALAGFAEHFATHSDRAPPTRPPPSGRPALPAAARWNEHEAKRVLAGWGLTMPREVAASTPEAAAAAARGMGGPVSLKILSPDIAHKTEVGGVALGLEGDAAVRDAAAAMLAAVRQRRPEARIDGFLVGPMLAGGVECVVGAHQDPAFGPLVMVGMGGVGVELLRDVAWRRAPVGVEAAEAMLRELRLAPLLFGHRGRPAADVGALCDAIVAVSRIAAENVGRLRALEVNPLLVMPAGGGAIVLDAVIETTSEPLEVA